MKSKSLLFSSLLGMSLAACAVEQGPVEADQSSSLSARADEVRVIIQYKNAMGREAAMAAGARIARDFPSRDAMAAYLPAAAVQGLMNNPNIALVEEDAVRAPLGEVTPYGVTMVQADQVPASPAAGESGRVKVCIIDSGIMAAHDDFAGLPISGNNDSGTGAYSTDLCGHGTHVAGTIAAMAGNGIGVVGVASGAVSLHIVKVFGDDCVWAYSSDLVAALDKCTAAGAKVVSMSLGGSFKSTFEQNAFAAADSAGVLSVAAAGNDGNTRMSYPASYPAVVSVAALDATETIAAFSQQNSQVEIAAPGVAVESTYPYENSLTVGAAGFNGNGIEFAALGSATGALADGGLCDSVGSFSGKVVLCERGVISFFDKVMNAQNGGAAGVVIYNNAPGNFNGTLGAGNSSNIPAISLSQEEGQALVASSLGQSGTVYSGLGSGYAALDGTSMATPHVSAVAALVWSQFPSATNNDIRNALNATAKDLGAAGRDNAYGYGLVQAAAAYDYLNGGGGPQCLPTGDSCSAGAECCSGLCSGKGPNKKCQ